MSYKGENITDLSKVQLELCQAVFDHFMENGIWPKSRKLHVIFRDKGELWEVAGGIDWRILRVGEKYQTDSVAKLSIEGISLCDGTNDFLDLIIGIVRLLVDTYIEHPESPQITFAELKNSLKDDDYKCNMACIAISDDPKIIQGCSILPDGNITNFNLSPDILRYKNVERIEDYLKILRDERDNSNKLDVNLQDILNSYSSKPAEALSQELFSLIPEIVKDEKLAKIILQDIKEMHCARSINLWKSVCLLCGSACEGILLSALDIVEPDNKEGKIHKNPDYNLSKLVQKAINEGILNDRDAKLAEYIRDSRNVIHPTKALKEGIIDKSQAIASYALLGIVCESIKRHVDQRKMP